MKLIKNIIEKRLEKKNFYELRRLYIRAFWEHLQIYTLAICFLKIPINKKEIRKRNNLYKKILLKRSVNNSDIIQITKIMNLDFVIINKAIDEIEKIKSESVSYGSYYIPGRVAIDVDDFPID